MSQTNINFIFTRKLIDVLGFSMAKNHSVVKFCEGFIHASCLFRRFPYKELILAYTCNSLSCACTLLKVTKCFLKIRDICG